jgi:hypothetical protein
MASTSNKVTTKTDEVEATTTNNNDLPSQDEEKNVDTPSTVVESKQDKTGQQQEQSPKSEESKSNPPPSADREEPKPAPSRSAKINKENIENSSTKSRSVNFKPTIETRSSTRRPVDFIDTLVESYKLETTNPFLSEEKKYVPKTNRNRLNPNWREHRTRRLMNKLEELSLWDREEEMKAAQAQWLRDQKWEQIQDRQRNHDLCLQLMRARHESEMESAVVLDRAVTGVNDENTSATIAAAMNLSSLANVIAYDLPMPPHSLKRRMRQQQEPANEAKTPIGRFRQFETTMDGKLNKINDKIQIDREIMRAYSPHLTSIPSSVVPLFSETYSTLLNIPESPLSSNRQHHFHPQHYGTTAYYLHQSQHASSPDYETRLRSYSNRDVRVPLKEQANDYNDYNSYNNDDDDYDYDRRINTNDDDYHHFGYRSPASLSRINYSPPRRTTSSASATASALYDYSTVANVPREHTFLHTRPPATNSIHTRSLNDDLNAITRFSTETTKKILQGIGERPPNGMSNSKGRSVSSNTNKRVTFPDLADDDDDDGQNYHQNGSSSSSRNSDNKNYSSSSRTKYQPTETLSLSSRR